MSKDRYEKLMQDWDEDTSWVAPEGSAGSARHGEFDYEEDESDESPSDSKNDRTERQAPTVQFRARHLERPPAFKSGTLVCLDESELIVYRGPARGQVYDMVYALLADGTAKLEGCELRKHQKYEMGRVSAEHYKLMQDHKRWTKQIIVESLFDRADEEIIPEPESANDLADQLLFTAPKPTAPSEKQKAESDSAPNERGSLIVPVDEPSLGRKMRRGQKFSLKLGATKWDAIYWGRDPNGTVIAHRTNQKWEMMHFDLGPYKNKIVITERVDQAIIDEIMKSV